MVRHKTLKQSRRGQSATELAVFGAVLVFLIGGIVRNSLTTSQQQNTELKAMRLALLQSYEGSRNRVVGRNSSNVLYFEDRLSPDISRYGNSDRFQLFNMGGGTLTNLLFYPLDGSELSDSRNLPTTDLYVNGIHFPITGGGVVTKNFSPPSGYQSFYTGSPTATLPTFPSGLTRYKSWEFNCLSISNTTGLPPVTTETVYGCPLFYSISTKAGDFGVLTENEAYDLNRNDNFEDDPGAELKTGMLPRTEIGWHWKAVRAADLDIDIENNTNTNFDVDNDGQEEQIYGFSIDGNHVVTSVTVMDYQEGDLDSSVTFINGRAPGLQREMSIITQTKPGTFFVVREGKLYNPENGEFARSISAKDQVELIQRMFQLTKNTGRFCSGGVPAATLPDGTSNPVEICGNSGGSTAYGGNAASTCFQGDNIKLTCLDTDTKMLYIRTRVLDKTGHAWLSDITGRRP